MHNSIGNTRAAFKVARGAVSGLAMLSLAAADFGSIGVLTFAASSSAQAAPCGSEKTLSGVRCQIKQVRKDIVRIDAESAALDHRAAAADQRATAADQRILAADQRASAADESTECFSKLKATVEAVKKRNHNKPLTPEQASAVKILVGACDI